MATIKDIAKAAGVSRGTVSNVLNKRGCVSHEKILLVENAAMRMGYVIDKNAGSLRKGVVSAIALIVPNISESRYSELYLGVLQFAQKNAYSLRLFLTDDLPYRERDAVREAMTERLGGILAVSCLSDHEKEYQSPLSAGVPVLFLERAAKKPLHSFSFDMKEVAHSIAAHLSADESFLALTENSLFSDQKALRSALMRTLRAPKERFYENTRGEQSDAAYRMLLESPASSCLIASNEMLADHLTKVCTGAGVRIRRMICLSPLRPAPDVFRDTVLLNYRKLGADACAAMIAHLKKKETLRSAVFPVSGYSASRIYGSRKGRTEKKALRILMHETPAVKALQCLLPEFTALSGNSATIEVMPLNRVFEEILSGNTRWDVIRIDPSSLSYLAPRIFLPLDSFGCDADTLYEDYLPALRQNDAFASGIRYALPFDISVQMLFYRKALFDSIAEQRAYYEDTGLVLRVPDSYEDFTSVARFFTRAYRADSPSRYGASCAMHAPTSAASEYLPRLLCENGLLYNANGRLNLMTDAALRALEGYLAFASCAHVTTDHSWSGIAEALVKGEHALSVLFTNHASYAVRAALSAQDSEIGFAPMPGGHALLGGGFLGVGIHSEAPKEAFSFVRWACGPSIAPRLVMMGGTSACRCVYEQEGILHTYPWLRELPKLLASGTRRPALAFDNARFNQRDFEYRLGENIIAARSGRITPAGALRDTQEYLDTIA